MDNYGLMTPTLLWEEKTSIKWPKSVGQSPLYSQFGDRTLLDWE